MLLPIVALETAAERLIPNSAISITSLISVSFARISVIHRAD
jgi:hypothetical protein